MFNPATGEFDDDEHPLGGDIGEQAGAQPIPLAYGAPRQDEIGLSFGPGKTILAGAPNPMPPPPSQAPGPEQMTQPPMPMPAPSPAAPVPNVLPASVPTVKPYSPQMPAPVPVSRVVTPAESANLASIDQNTAARQGTAQDQGGVSAAGATAKSQEAESQSFIADSFRQEQRRIADEATKRIQERQKQANDDYEAFKAFGIKDPQASDNFATRILKAIAVGMGGYAAGINGGPNTALQIITEANKENIARQKAQQEKLFQVATKSGKDVEQATKERDDAFKQLDLKHAALLDSSAAMLREQLAKLGVPQAQINTNADVQKIEQAALAERERTLAGIRDDETRLAQADISAAARAAAAAARKPKGGGGGPGPSLDTSSQLADYVQQHPGDTPGLYTYAAKLGLSGKAGQKAVADALKQNKVEAGESDKATKAASAIRAIDNIEKMKYTPSRDEVQKWINNQRQVEQAQEMGKGGGAKAVIGGLVSGGLQSVGALAQNEFDGLSPRARMYFTNVRRYMENIGRTASGAAISQGEWNNFYGQYGPQSEGGLAAAREQVRDQFKLTGTAGRVLEKSGSVPAAAPAVKREDPRAKLAREAIADPKATRAEKAKALQILRSLGQVDTL